ncbi:MAG: polysaccharide deacetylase family protein [Patescibacteria group bacterium]|nr:polysaccharide deacetylase family protein [Patescibacteria group bacterium]
MPAQAATSTVPVYRLANFMTHERLFTTNAAERDNAVQHLAGWVSEGTAFDSVQASEPQAVPVYRLANWMTHERLFTTSAAERDNAAQHLAGWVSEGTAFYTVPAANTSAVPVYRLANWMTHERLFTTNAAERDNAVQHLSGWVSEGTAFYSVTSSSVASPTPSPSASPSPSPSPTPTPGINLISNPSVETANGAVPTGWTQDTWGNNVAAFGYEPTVPGHTGRAIKVSYANYTPDATNGGDAKWGQTAAPVTAGSTYQFSDWYQSDVDTEVDVAYTVNGVAGAQWEVLSKASASSSWAQYSAQFTAPAGATAVTIYHILAAKGSLTTDDYALSAYTPAGFSSGMVSFTFDDAWANIYTNGLPLLSQYGIHSTQYLLTGMTSSPDYMTVAMMQAFAAQGSEIASHTITHPDLATLTVAQMDAELGGAQTALQGWFPGLAIDDFATPYGSYNTTVLAEIQKYYPYHRSTDVGFNDKNFNPHNIKVQNILSTTSVAQVQAWINQAAQDHTWLVLVYHQVTPTAPAAEAGGAPDVYWTTPADLAAELAYAKTSGATPLSVKEAINAITPQLGN